MECTLRRSETRDGRVARQGTGQAPRMARLARHAGLPALRRQDAVGRSVPVTRHDQRTLPHARRQVDRSEDGLRPPPLQARPARTRPPFGRGARGAPLSRRPGAQLLRLRPLAPRRNAGSGAGGVPSRRLSPEPVASPAAVPGVRAADAPAAARSARRVAQPLADAAPGRRPSRGFAALAANAGDRRGRRASPLHGVLPRTPVRPANLRSCAGARPSVASIAPRPRARRRGSPRPGRGRRRTGRRWGGRSRP